MSLDDLFEAMPDATTVETFAHEHACGFVIKYSLKGTGFGEMTFARRTEDGVWSIDDESCSAEQVAKILELSFPQGEVTQLDHQNLGSQATVSQLARAFDEIDAGGIPRGRFGSEGMNALVDRYAKLRDATSRAAGRIVPPDWHGPKEDF